MKTVVLVSLHFNNLELKRIVQDFGKYTFLLMMLNTKLKEEGH